VSFNTLELRKGQTGNRKTKVKRKYEKVTLMNCSTENGISVVIA